MTNKLLYYLNMIGNSYSLPQDIVEIRKYLLDNTYILNPELESKLNLMTNFINDCHFLDDKTISNLLYEVHFNTIPKELFQMIIDDNKFLLYNRRLPISDTDKIDKLISKIIPLLDINSKPIEDLIPYAFYVSLMISYHYFTVDFDMLAGINKSIIFYLVNKDMDYTNIVSTAQLFSTIFLNDALNTIKVFKTFLPNRCIVYKMLNDQYSTANQTLENIFNLIPIDLELLVNSETTYLNLACQQRLLELILGLHLSIEDILKINYNTYDNYFINQQ